MTGRASSSRALVLSRSLRTPRPLRGDHAMLAVWLLSSLLACAHGGTLDGAWRSVPGEAASGAEIVHVYKDGQSMVVFDGKCGPLERVEIEAAAGNEVTLRFYDGAGRPTVQRRFVVEGDRMLVPVRTATGQDREVFERVDEAVLAEEHECARELLAR